MMANQLAFVLTLIRSRKFRIGLFALAMIPIVLVALARNVLTATRCNPPALHSLTPQERWKRIRASYRKVKQQVFVKALAAGNLD
jgi:hypothetical protein